MPNDIHYIRTHVSYNALISQLGEELAELAQALFKLRRAKGNGNPTPVTLEEAEAAVQEEVSDLRLVCEILNVPISIDEDDAGVDTAETVVLFSIGHLIKQIPFQRTMGYSTFMSDIMTNCQLMGYDVGFDPENPKLTRWVERIKEAEHGKTDS